MPPVATESTFETLTVETSEGICTITLNRPEVYNAFSDKLTFELQHALKGAERDADAKVIIITGAGRGFCSGQDVAELKQKYVPGHVPHLGKDIRQRYNPIARRLREMDKPVIGAVNGVAAGAGMTLVGKDGPIGLDLRAEFMAQRIHPHATDSLVKLTVSKQIWVAGPRVGADFHWKASPVLGVVAGTQLSWTGRPIDLEVDNVRVDRFPAVRYAFTGGIRVRLSK